MSGLLGEGYKGLFGGAKGPFSQFTAREGSLADFLGLGQTRAEQMRPLRDAAIARIGQMQKEGLSPNMIATQLIGTPEFQALFSSPDPSASKDLLGIVQAIAPQRTVMNPGQTAVEFGDDGSTKTLHSIPVEKTAIERTVDAYLEAKAAGDTERANLIYSQLAHQRGSGKTLGVKDAFNLLRAGISPNDPDMPDWVKRSGLDQKAAAQLYDTLFPSDTSTRAPSQTELVMFAMGMPTGNPLLDDGTDSQRDAVAMLLAETYRTSTPGQMMGMGQLMQGGKTVEESQDEFIQAMRRSRQEAAKMREAAQAEEDKRKKAQPVTASEIETMSLEEIEALAQAITEGTRTATEATRAAMLRRYEALRAQRGDSSGVK